ncbi:hypothetical protein D4764_02G0000890 [Takifugu flavidus]|uniref:Uncharacterized protein n=1 Tax=Takifugu flavidus TaxID=433684 RepID=A0A5C6NJW6_9TELE|nr:hypothetical protein D4764_02G0000890 [Takifugu flavidus]
MRTEETLRDTKGLLSASFEAADSANSLENSKTALTESSNCFQERPPASGGGAAGRSSVLAGMTALPQRYSPQRRRTSPAAARRMERRRREQGRNNDPTSDHNYRSRKLAMLSRYE